MLSTKYIFLVDNYRAEVLYCEKRRTYRRILLEHPKHHKEDIPMAATPAVSKSRFRTVDMAYIALFAVLMAVCAWVTIPIPGTLISFTLQTFAIFTALLTLGGRRGTYAVLVYLLLGLVGLPVFSGFQGGPGVLLGATGGYIIGFVGSALVYWLMTAKLGDSLPVAVVACVVGLAVCYAFGTVWFLKVYTSGPMDLATALSWCVTPFIIPDLCKLALATLLSKRVKKFLK
jgi:biotin transport system substrate-specific component